MGRKHILLVDDSREDAFLLERAFAAAGVRHPIHFARDGQEAIDYLTARPAPLLMILDLKMPRLDGFDVLRWLQQRADLKRLVVTVLSSSGHERDVNRAYDLGANSYLVKPGPADDYDMLAGRLRDYWLELNRFPDGSRLR